MRAGSNALRALAAASIGMGLCWSLLRAQSPPPPPPPKVGFVLKDRHGHATPQRVGKARSGGGNTDVSQPRDDTLIITMTGAVTAGPHPCQTSSSLMAFDLNQEFEIGFADPKLKSARLSVEAQLVGLLRGDKHGGSAGFCSAAVAVASLHDSLLSLALEEHAVTDDDNLAVNDHKGPVVVPVLPGKYHLLQTLHISAAHVRSLAGKAASAEFAPDPALDPTWISITEPFHGANKKEFGFRVLLRIEPE
jgi:hypothetical protein